MKLKKSYRGFVLWMLGFVAGMAAIILLGTADAALMTRVLLCFTAADVALLAFIVWRTEQIYWYNGTEYEEAVKAGRERRRTFAWRHFRTFGGYALGQIIFCGVMHLLGLPWWIDIIVFCVGLCSAAFSTMRIRL
ncbi:MAG: hypothetical protein IKK21_00560 [Clostridia bacterium]|nr:hypothetical protein [Clostridia bacterium]